MGITFVQAFLIALLYWVAVARWGGYLIAAFERGPLAGLAIGLIMGKPIEGLVMGAMVQTLNMAPSYIGRTTTMDLGMATYIAVPFALAGGLDVKNILAFAIPFTVLGAVWQPVSRTIQTTVGLSLVDKAIEEGNLRKFYWANYVFPGLVIGALYFIPMFCTLYFGQYVMQAILEAIPERLMIALIAMSKFLPGLGFAIFLRAAAREDRMPFFFLGYYVAYFLKLPVIALTIFGAILAVVVMLAQKTTEEGSAA